MSMDGWFVPKRPYKSEPPLLQHTTISSTKRRHHHHHPPSSAPPQFRPPSSTLKLAAGEAFFRILCPATKTGGLIGKGGAIIREDTGAKIRIEDAVPGCEERVILIIAVSAREEDNSTCTVDRDQNTVNLDVNSDELADDEGSPAQQALVRVFERILKVDEERCGDGEKSEEGGDGNGVNSVVCRLLAASNQVGCVLGRGGKIIERIRHDSGAKVRVLSKDLIPSCASPGDELIQITGSFSAVRKALFSVSGCLQDNPRADAGNSTSTNSPGMPLHGTGIENLGTNHRMVLEEEVVFKLLCQVEKVGSLIGKGGSKIRALQSETGASIKIADAAPDSDERVVVISARENSEQRHSPAQDAVIRVHGRITEIGFEPGAAVVARILVHSQQMGRLFGKGGVIIAELRRATGASICVFPKEQVPKYGYQTDEVVQVIGSLQSVQDALFQITSRLREIIFPMKPHLLSVSGSPYLSPYPEMPPPLFSPRHDSVSPGYPSPVGLPRGAHRVAIPSQHPEPRPAFFHGIDRFGPAYLERVPYYYGSERPGNGPSFDRLSSPERWSSQAVNTGNLGAVADHGGGFALISGPSRSEGHASIVASTHVEVVIPETLLSHVYGENSSNLVQIRQISRAKVVVHNPRPGATEGMVVVSGTPDQIHTAQSLIHAFILCEQNP